MKKSKILSSLALLGAISLVSVTIQPAIAQCGFGDITCNPKQLLSQGTGTRLRPDLNGLQLRNPGNGRIYWVDKGQIRHILNPSVYSNLFIPKALNAIDTVSITQGLSVTDANRLVRCGEGNHPLRNRIYFLDQGTKRHITSPTVMNRNNFNWDKVKNVDCPALASIPDGEPIN